MLQILFIQVLFADGFTLYLCMSQAVQAWQSAFWLLKTGFLAAGTTP